MWHLLGLGFLSSEATSVASLSKAPNVRSDTLLCPIGFAKARAAAPSNHKHLILEAHKS